MNTRAGQAPPLHACRVGQATPLHDRRGMTLAECLIALLVSLVLIAAIDATLVAGQRFSRASAATRGLRQNLRAAAAVLRAELASSSPAAGDLHAISDSAVTLRAVRLSGIACAIQPGGRIVLADSLLSQLRAADPTRDSARVFRAGNALTATDDRWIAGAVTHTGRGTCPGGGAATTITITGTASDLSGLGAPAPVVIFETDEYRRYRDATGLWWLGVRGWSASGWAAMSPIAGPLATSSGLRFAWFDTTGTSTSVPASVSSADVQLRLRDDRALGAFDRLRLFTADSATVRIRIGGP
jgi:prepilin-type N-terminal cleavage/methylation domain-containing protein